MAKVHVKAEIKMDQWDKPIKFKGTFTTTKDMQKNIGGQKRRTKAV